MCIEPDGSFSYKVDISGFQPNEVTVDVEGDNLVVKGQHKANNEREFFLIC